ncbi:MAG: alkaline phosphatase family protein [Acidobacteriia bacterium]|nr:alkaline phosphatase family protein [Terriglobia bacterium]
MKKKRKLNLFVLIDALGWPYVQAQDFLVDLLPYRRSLRTVLGFSSGAIPTILTGQLPTFTGHWNLFYYDPQGSPFRWLRYFAFLPDAVLTHRVATKLIKELGRRVMGMGPLFECCVSPRLLPWFNWLEKRNIYAKGGITGAPSIFDELDRRNIAHHVYTYHHLTDKQILEQACKDVQNSDAGFYFIYLCEMDMFLHMNCAKPAKVSEKLAWYESQIRELYELARTIDPDTVLTIMSDHGMTPVRQHFDLVSKIEMLAFKMPQDYLAVYDSTMARFWFFNDKTRVAFDNLLNDVHCGHIISERELRDLGIWFDDGRYGEVIFLLDPGWLFAKSDFTNSQWVPAGMHGYHPADPYSDAVFLTNRKPPVEMRTIADIHACMMDVIG